ncbi:hypothetical protein [Pantoea sp.]|uniref:hypothetical protein n=1 Tax=Pantoea sp. TaxID=69393 RepID=UPI00289A8FEB|nr:hypothetical protein [Pantoea sp.]
MVRKTQGINYGPIKPDSNGLYRVNLSVLDAESVNGGPVRLHPDYEARLLKSLKGKFFLGVTNEPIYNDWESFQNTGLYGFQLVQAYKERLEDGSLLISADIKPLDTLPGALIKRYLESAVPLNFRLAAYCMFEEIDGRTVKYVTAVRSFDLILPDTETLAESDDD